MKRICIGLLAHVDAGKTTLSESFLYISKTLRKQGRVDKQDAFLDYDGQERKRGITIYAKQARFTWKETIFTLLDTPGHLDFSPEMERTLSVLDVAILIVNGMEGIQSHTKTIWQLLKHYHVPTLLFVNKMDASYLSKEELLQQIQQDLDQNAVVFTNDATWDEQIAMLEDRYLEYYMEHQTICDTQVQEAWKKRNLFPVLFGSALRNDQVSELLNFCDRYATEPQYVDTCSIKPFKISYDEQNNRLVHLRVLGTPLKVKQQIKEDKIDQIRMYHGNRYETVSISEPGSICSVKGLHHLQLHEVVSDENSQIHSFLMYQVAFPSHVSLHQTLQNFQKLQDEDPQLCIQFHSQTQQIYLQLMGEVHGEVLKQAYQERFQTEVDFEPRGILYKETIADQVEGYGHFEPLKHYAEVHVRLEPLAQGSGILIENICSQDELATSWQSQILHTLKNTQFPGIRSGYPLTDVKITLLRGKAHQKHTEGGDFKEATIRAVRQGLQKAKSILLEPYYQYEIDIPSESLGKVMFDLEQKHATMHVEETIDRVKITGTAPVQYMQDYQKELLSMTQGKGKMLLRFDRFAPCQEQEKHLERIAYDPQHDLAFPSGSIFCEHGAKKYVPWHKVEAYMHLESEQIKKAKASEKKQPQMMSEQEVLDKLFSKGYGVAREKRYKRKKSKEEAVVSHSSHGSKPACILIDGYNFLHASKSLAQEAKENLHNARHKVIDALCNYQGYKKQIVIVVFDAYEVDDPMEKVQQIDNIYVVYTKYAQSADHYIEAVTHQLASQFQTIVVTSDAAVQLISMGQGAQRMSSRELWEELRYWKQKGQAIMQRQNYHFAQPLQKLREYTFSEDDVEETKKEKN